MPGSLEEASKNRGNLADNAPQARATLAQLPIQLGGRSVRDKNFFNQETMLFEAVAVGVSLVRPVREKSRAHWRQPARGAGRTQTARYRRSSDKVPKCQRLYPNR